MAKESSNANKTRAPANVSLGTPALNVTYVSGLSVNLDPSNGIAIIGLLSGMPFQTKPDSFEPHLNFAGAYAFNKDQLRFLRDQINKFLEDDNESSPDSKQQ